jgi:hypothetical protein
VDRALAGLIVVGILAGAVGLVWPLVWLVEQAVYLAERAYRRVHH